MRYSFLETITIAALLLGAPLMLWADQMQAGDPVEQQVKEASPVVVDLKALSTMEQMLKTLQSKRVIFVGESHDRYEHHLSQLAVIEGLYNKGKDLAIGMEFFQQPFQSYLDAYVAGDISEKELLRKTEYFERWRFDYRLYQPILRFAREHGIPLIALNVESEITSKVGNSGIGSLSKTELSRIPDEIDRDDADYRKRIKAAFDNHPMEKKKDFENFLDVQLLWDEGMADRAAGYLREHPGKQLVILAGSGHLEYGQGIPKRLLRRVPVESAIVLSATERELDPERADYLLSPKPANLPASGLLGVLLDTDSKGQGIAVQGFADTSGAKEAGLEEGDRIVKVGDDPINSYSDIRITLLDSHPGDKLPVEILRKHMVGKDERLTFEVQLQ